MPPPRLHHRPGPADHHGQGCDHHPGGGAAHHLRPQLQRLGEQRGPRRPERHATFTLTPTGPTTYAIQPGGLTASNYQIQFGSGTLTVLSWSQATTNLLKQVNDAGLEQGIQNSLDSKLQAALDSFSQGNQTAAKNQLAAFLNEVSAQSGKKIDDALADALSASAQRILNAVG